MADENDLAAAIVAAVGDKSRDGLSPQGEASVRLALHVGRLQKELAHAPKVELVEALDQPTHCKVYIDGVLRFAGRDYSADVQTPVRPEMPEFPPGILDSHDPDEWKEDF